MKQDSKPKTQDPKPKTPPTWVKDADGIAKAWGMKLYEQRKMMVKQLDAVRAAIKDAGFPVKVKGKGYDRAAVMAFAMERVEMHQSQRKFVLSLESKALSQKAATQDARPKTQDPRRDLPEQDEPANGELFENTGFEATLDLWQDKLNFPMKWQESPLQNWQMKHLQKHRPHLFEKDDAGAVISSAESENIEGGYRGVAGWIRNNYQGRLSRLPNHTDIVNWSRGEYLPAGCRENFPASEANNSRYKTALVVAWVEKYIIKAETGQALPLTGLDDRQRKEKADADLAEMAAEAQRKKLSGLYVLTETAERTGTAIGIALRTLTREALERALPKRFAEKVSSFKFQVSSGETTGLPPEAVVTLKEQLLADCVAVFTDWQRQAQARLDELLKQAQMENLTTEKNG